MNKRMVAKIRKTPYKRVHVPKCLNSILEEGLMVKNDCLFIRCFYNANPHLTESQFEDKTQYEHTMNGFHFDDYYKKCTINHIFAFVDELEKRIRSTNIRLPVLIVISFNKDDCYFSLGRVHENEMPWIDPTDLENYNEAIILMQIG